MVKNNKQNKTIDIEKLSSKIEDFLFKYGFTNFNSEIFSDDIYDVYKSKDKRTIIEISIKRD